MATVVKLLYVSLLFVTIQSQHIFPNGTRNKYVWPFASESIWNHAIGSDAVYVPAGINGSEHFGIDNDIWVVTSSSDPKISWYPPYNWDERCKIGSQKEYSYKVPWPSSFSVPDASPPNTPNYASAILLPDQESLLQMEPTCRDETGSSYPIFGYSVGCAQNPDENNFTSIYSNGYYGGHFGSGLSSIGGTVRFNELVKNGTIKHAIKWEVWGQMYLYNDHSGNDNSCKRWPAAYCDSSWKTSYGGVTNATRQGTLLAIPPSIANDLINKLQTEPGRIMLKALTDYGAYIVDDSGWDQQQFCIENGVEDEFKKNWGMEMTTGSPFANDMIMISKYFHVVNNNGPESIGGGGELRQPLPPDIGN